MAFIPTHVYESEGIQPSELEPGIALFLHPELLWEGGGRCNQEWHESMLGAHYFVCLDVERHDGIWVPASSKARPGRFALHPRDKRGHEMWRRGRSCCVVDQLWEIPHDAVLEAAFLDDSRPSCRGFVEATAFERLIVEAAH